MSLSQDETLLRDRLRRWLDTQPRGVANLSERPGPPWESRSFALTPTRAGACAVTLWVGDNPNEIGAALDVGGAWWDMLSDAPGYVEAFCDAVARGSVLEETRLIGRKCVARQVTVLLENHKPRRHAVFSPFLFFPYPKWNTRASMAWSDS